MLNCWPDSLPGAAALDQRKKGEQCFPHVHKSSHLQERARRPRSYQRPLRIGVPSVRASRCEIAPSRSLCRAASHWTAWLEREGSSDLDDSGLMLGAGDDAEIGIGDAPVGVSKVSMVENIEKLALQPEGVILV